MSGDMSVELGDCHDRPLYVWHRSAACLCLDLGSNWAPLLHLAWSSCALGLILAKDASDGNAEKKWD